MIVLDINGKALERIGDSRISTILGDGCCMPLEDNAYDVVVSVDSLEHVPGSRLNKGGAYMHLKYPEQLEKTFSSYDRNKVWPGSFWLRRKP